MADFLRTSKISSQIEDIIVDAKESITFVTPYLKFNKTLYERIKERDDEGVAITFVYGKSKLLNDQEQLLNKLKNVTVHFLENLHAKCYINESAGIVTSMNLYDFSEKNNREMGIYFRKIHDEDLYSQVLLEVNSIIKAATYTNFNCQTSNNINNTQIINPTINRNTSIKYLHLKLQKEFKNSHFEYLVNFNKIVCNDFMDFFKLEIKEIENYIHINFQFVTKQYKNKKWHYSQLNTSKIDIEANFPKNTVMWNDEIPYINLKLPQNNSELKDSSLKSNVDYIIKASLLFRKIIQSH